MPSNNAIAIRDLCENKIARFDRILPPGFGSQRFLAGLYTALSRSPKLAQCSPGSVYMGALESAHLGLPLDGVGGHAHLVPYKDKAQLIVGYKGLIALARKSGIVSSVYAYAVHEGDPFSYTLGDNPSITHEPLIDNDGEIVAVYAVAKLTDGGQMIEVLGRKQIDATKNRSRARSGPWVTDFEAMARKTAIRRLCKYLPSLGEHGEALQRAVSNDELLDSGIAPDFGAGLDSGDDLETINADATEDEPQQEAQA